jgi:hypothetical protein
VATYSTTRSHRTCRKEAWFDAAAQVAGRLCPTLPAGWFLGCTVGWDELDRTDGPEPGSTSWIQFSVPLDGWAWTSRSLKFCLVVEEGHNPIGGLDSDVISGACQRCVGTQHAKPGTGRSNCQGGSTGPRQGGEQFCEQGHVKPHDMDATSKHRHLANIHFSTRYCLGVEDLVGCALWKMERSKSRLIL